MRTILSDLCSQIDYGLTTSAVNSGQGPRFLRITDIQDSVIDWATVPRCIASQSERERYALTVGDIVVARTGASTGRSAWIADLDTAGSLFASYLVRFRVKTHVNSRFIAYVLRSPDWSDFIRANAHSKSAQPNLAASAMASFQFDTPAPSVQVAIAAVLGALDDKIAANTAVAQTSFQLAATIFRAIPADDRTPGQLGDVLSLNYGRALPATARREGSATVVGSGGVVGTHDVALLTGPSVVVGRKGSVGATHWIPGPSFPIDTTYYVVPRGNASLVYCYFLLESLDLASMNSDSAVPGLNRTEALAVPISIPDEDSMRDATSMGQSLLGLADQVAVESRSLAELRDTLLPALMSGRLRVKDVERQVEDAV